MSIEIGQPAPDFTLPSSAGGEVTLSDLRGKPVVLWFYPKDNTSGCTKEACAFRDLSAEFEAAGAVNYGISKDSLGSHERFISKHGLTSPLLSDEDTSVQQLYGVWAEKKNYGKTYFGIARTTFLIDPEGKIARVWPKVKVDGHAAAVLEAVREMAAA